MSKADKETTIDLLTSLGLTLGESKTYIALVGVGSSEATPLAEMADVPQSKIYGYLKSLESNHNLVSKIDLDGKPNMYEAIDFEVAIETLSSKFEQNKKIALNYIQSLKEQSSSSESVGNLINIVQGERLIKANVKSIGSDSENLFYMAAEPMYEEIKDILNEYDAKIFEFKDVVPRIPPPLKMLYDSGLRDHVNNNNIVIILKDIDFDERTCQSVNIIGYPEEETELDPLMISIKHPVIVDFQIKMLLGIFDIINTQVNVMT